MFDAHSKIGVWGYGIVGTSVIHFLLREQKGILAVHDRNHFSSDTKKMFEEHNIKIYEPSALEEFLSDMDIIIPSPGIDLRPFAQYQRKWQGEYDIFCRFWKKKIIAITGTIGKTSVTHFLQGVLESCNVRCVIGGNIGKGMLDLLPFQSEVDIAIIELSSFQLEISKAGAADIAVITNIFENHFDRHALFQDYVNAKLNILKSSKSSCVVLIPHNLVYVVQKNIELNHRLIPLVIGPSDETNTEYSRYHYYLLDHALRLWKYEAEGKVSVPFFPPEFSYLANWAIIGVIIDILNLTMPYKSMHTSITTVAHRFEKIGVYDDISFYNDSKSTILEATIAAIERLKNRSIILFLGGVSKGVDRMNRIHLLSAYALKHVVCFGKEGKELAGYCIKNSLSASYYPTLQEAVFACLSSIAQVHDHVLFSPGGASFDLFKNYEERGKNFTQLVHDFYSIQ